MAAEMGKTADRTTAVLYGDELKEKIEDERRTKELLLDAIENDGFYMVYQPQVDTFTREVCGYEALVRMKAPNMYPGRFIPVAEKAGLIWKIGRITTELVIRQIAEWRDAGYKLHPVSINFSSLQMNDDGYLDFFRDMMKTYNIPTELVEIEITESLFIGKTDQANNLFGDFKSMGISLLMDDFGTGYSSLGYLAYIPVDIIKLDKLLVDNYLVEGKDQFIKNVIVEGVETAEQVNRLADFGADAIQGYYFSKPVMPDEAIHFRAS
jgi:EAL domain-containing protein (putative c-di-GMP-specific phosphodiesterase class I)